MGMIVAVRHIAEKLVDIYSTSIYSFVNRQYGAMQHLSFDSAVREGKIMQPLNAEIVVTTQYCYTNMESKHGDIYTAHGYNDNGDSASGTWTPGVDFRGPTGAGTTMPPHVPKFVVLHNHIACDSSFNCR
jgi:hypothetical protein